MKNSVLFVLFISLNITTLFSQKEYIKKYYGDNTVLKEEGWVDNDNRIGYWVFYHENGTIQKKGHFEDSYPIKYWYFYREDGSPEKEGHFVNGKQNKWWLFYNKKGDISHKCQLVNNQRDGYCLLYKEKKLIKALRFSNDKKVNEWTDFSSFRRDNDLSDLK